MQQQFVTKETVNLRKSNEVISQSLAEGKERGDCSNYIIIAKREKKLFKSYILSNKV